MEPLSLSLDELRQYDGSDLNLPIYLAIKGTIFDVSKGIHLTLVAHWRACQCHTNATVEIGCRKPRLETIFWLVGRQFYGPDGIYPFAGRECARAFALLSTDTNDCVDNLDGLDKMEMDNLRDWQEKFYTKYKLVGKIAK